MTRTVRSLALVTLAVSVILVLYSFSVGASFLGGLLQTINTPLLLQTTDTALGLTTAIVALVANAQARHWRWFSAYVVLAIVTTYGQLLVTWATQIFPGFLKVVELSWWWQFSYSVPPVATALLVLAEVSHKRTPRTSPDRSGDETDEVEITPLKS